MKVAFKAWTDTKNVDLIFEAESDAEAALLLLMQDRDFEWTLPKNDGLKFEGVLKQKKSTPDNVYAAPRY